jgi:hypothetical protein
MFHAIRLWWMDGRGQLTARLFAFEFVVVVAGVLAAQGLANWVQSRAERTEATRLLADARQSATDLDEALNYWQRFGPCVLGRADAIGRAASAGEGMSEAEIGRPSLPGVSPLGFAGEEWRRLAKVERDPEIAALRSLQSTSETYSQYMAETSRQWALLALLVGSSGAPSAEDRSRVRAASASIKNNVRWLMRVRRSVGDDFATLGIADTPINALRLSLVDQCGMMKGWQ